MRPYTLLILFLLLIAPQAFGDKNPEAEILAAVDSSLSREKGLYWLKCESALQSRRQSRNHALKAVSLFLANVPLEYAASQYRHTHKEEPVRLNAAAFALLGASLLHLSWSIRGYQDYQRDRNCCRHWQDYVAKQN